MANKTLGYDQNSEHRIYLLIFWLLIGSVVVTFGLPFIKMLLSKNPYDYSDFKLIGMMFCCFSMFYSILGTLKIWACFLYKHDTSPIIPTLLIAFGLAILSLIAALIGKSPYVIYSVSAIFICIVPAISFQLMIRRNNSTEQT